MDGIETVGTKEATKELGITQTRVAELCRDGQFAGAKRIGRTWGIPLASIRYYTSRPVGRPKSR